MSVFDTRTDAHIYSIFVDAMPNMLSINCCSTVWILHKWLLIIIAALVSAHILIADPIDKKSNEMNVLKRPRNCEYFWCWNTYFLYSTDYPPNARHSFITNRQHIVVQRLHSSTWTIFLLFFFLHFLLPLSLSHSCALFSRLSIFKWRNTLAKR